MKKNLIYILTIIVLTIGWSNTIAQTNNTEKSYLGSWVGNQKSFKALYKLKINDTSLLFTRTYPGRTDTAQNLINPNKIHFVKGYPRLDTMNFKYYAFNEAGKVIFYLYPGFIYPNHLNIPDTAIFVKADFEHLQPTKSGKPRAKFFVHFPEHPGDNDFIILEKEGKLDNTMANNK